MIEDSWWFRSLNMGNGKLSVSKVLKIISWFEDLAISSSEISTERTELWKKMGQKIWYDIKMWKKVKKKVKQNKEYLKLC
jgi:hypothetical protein